MGLFFYFLACFSAVFSLLSSHCSDGADIFGQSCGPFFGFLACVFNPIRVLFCFHTALILQIFIGKTEVKLVHAKLGVDNFSLSGGLSNCYAKTIHYYIKCKDNSLKYIFFP